MPPLADTERHWNHHYPTGTMDPLASIAGGPDAFLLRSLSSHGNHGGGGGMPGHHSGHPSLPESLLGTLATTPGVPLSDLYAASQQSVAGAHQSHQSGTGHQMAAHPHQNSGMGAASANVLHAGSQHSAVMNGGGAGLSAMNGGGGLNGLMGAGGQGGTGSYMFSGQAADPWGHQHHPQHHQVSHQMGPQHHVGHTVHQTGPHPPPSHGSHGHKGMHSFPQKVITVIALVM